MESKLIYIVYCTTCIDNNKIYIGVHQTNTLEFDGYIGNGVYINNPSTYKHPKTKFQYAVKKHGVSKFKRCTIAVFENSEDAYALEGCIVNKQFLQRQDVYNMALGGTNGAYYLTCKKVFQYSEKGEFIKEHESIHKAALEIKRSNISIFRAIKDRIKCKGYFWSDTKFDVLNTTLFHQYKGLNEIPVFQYDLKGNYECCYDSIQDCARILNINDSNLCVAIKLGTVCHNKYYSSIYSTSFDVSRNTQTRNTAIHQYSLTGEYIASFNNMKEAKNKLNISSNIYNAIKLGRTCGDFQWSFEKLDRMDPIKPKSGKSREVGKYDKDWNLIEKYPSLAEAKRKNSSSVEHVIRGRNEFSKGYRYKYID